MKRQRNASGLIWTAGCAALISNALISMTSLAVSPPDWREPSGTSTASRWNQFRRPSRPIGDIVAPQAHDPAARPHYHSIAAVPQELLSPSIDDDLLLPPASPTGQPFSQGNQGSPAPQGLDASPVREDLGEPSAPNPVEDLLIPQSPSDAETSRQPTPLEPQPDPAFVAPPADQLTDQQAEQPIDQSMDRPIAPSLIDPAGAGAGEAYEVAMGSPQSCAMGPRLRPIAPWYGGSNLLFLSGGDDFGLVRGATLSRPYATGFDVSVGRYLCCGRYGIGLSYLFWGPGEQAFVTGASNAQFISPGLNAVSVNDGGRSNNNVYNVFGVPTTASTTSTQLRLSRQIGVQGVEATFSCFGIMGANRYGTLIGAPYFGFGLGRLARFGRNNVGGAVGPLGRSRSQRVHVVNSHGFRWFQLKDELTITGDTDGVQGFGPDDMAFNIDVQNDLFGYQFGSNLIYRVGNRAWMDFGGKMGLYSNNASFRHRIGSASDVAFTNSQGPGAGDINTSDSTVTLAGLGELNLGLGYRVTNGISITGGYRLLGVSGVATALGQIPMEYSTASRSSGVAPNDSLILNGAYVGMGLNW